MTEQTDGRDITEWEEAGYIDAALAKRTWADLTEGITHGLYCLCPSCKHQLHQARGGRFDKESFFLYWLELEAILSLAKQTVRLEFPEGRGAELVASIKGPWWKDLSRRSGVIRIMAMFIYNNFPDISKKPGEDRKRTVERLMSRIKVKLWRFKKSGVDSALEAEIIGNRHKKTTPGPGWKELRLAQRIADYIYEQPGHTATQRQLCRRFQKPVQAQVIEELRACLLVNWGIVCQRGKRMNQVVYRGMKTSRGLYFRMGLGPAAKPFSAPLEPSAD